MNLVLGLVPCARSRLILKFAGANVSGTSSYLPAAGYVSKAHSTATSTLAPTYISTHTCAQADSALCSSALLALLKLMAVDEGFCEAHMQLVFQDVLVRGRWVCAGVPHTLVHCISLHT